MTTMQDVLNNIDPINFEPNYSPDEINEEYKNKQRERLSKLIVGEFDVSGHKITNVFSRGDEYVIYEIAAVSEAESFRVLIDTEIESDPKGMIGKFESIKEDLVEFRSILFKGVHDAYSD